MNRSLNRRSFLRCLSSALGVLLAVQMAACGGGGGGGGGPTEPPPPQPGIVVTPAAAPATGISIGSGAGSTTTTLILEIRANSVNNLYGVAFDLSYPSNLLQLVQAGSGPFLGSPNLQSSPGPTPGTVLVGLSKLGTSVGSSGSGVLMTLEFQAIASGEGTFAFEQNTAIDPTGETIDNFGWAAGTVRVTR